MCKGMTIVAIETIFIYENKYYQQVLGDAMESPFTLKLATIFKRDCEQQ